MSIEHAKRFLEAAAKDQTLQGKLDAAGPKDLARIAIQAGSERGFTFTAEELLSSIKPSSVGGELSDDQLGAVAGGMEGLSPAQQAALDAIKSKGGGLEGGIKTTPTRPTTLNPPR